MRDAAASETLALEPLVRLSDLAEYQAGLAQHKAGAWDDERWTSYRVRFGVYGQKQPGVQMVRIKIPGGVVPVEWLPVIVAANRQFAQGDAHFTTRQDVQIYSVPLDATPDLLHHLYSNGVTTREACGNTLRNMTSCALAGSCPREHTDAGKVAAQLARSWLRNPLVQHMPRKAKFTVSGCDSDCGHSLMHDLGFIATERNGKKGFRVNCGGGLGAQPRPAIEVLDFVEEFDLPRVIEAFARIHQRYSDRRNRNASRIKFAVKRFGADKFRQLFQEEFDYLKGLSQRPWEPLIWRDAEAGPDLRSPVGVINANSGLATIVVSVPLGIVSSDQLDALYYIATKAGVAELRLTRDQNVAFLNVAWDQVEAVKAGVKTIGFDVPESAEAIPTFISCPGTTTCRIGITSSQLLASHALALAEDDESAKGISTHISGCQNSCGLHHVADFGLHGMAKKIDGQTAPHYQLHFGGDARRGEIGLSGPMIPAKLADQALKLLRDAYAPAKAQGQSVRAWVEKLGKDGINGVLAPLDEQKPDDIFIDWGDSNLFPGAPQARGDCAAPFAMDEYYGSAADDALITIDRALRAGQTDKVETFVATALRFAGRRLLQVAGILTTDLHQQDFLTQEVKTAFADQADVLAAYEAVAAGDSDLDALREKLALLIDTARALAEPTLAEDEE